MSRLLDPVGRHGHACILLIVVSPGCLCGDRMANFGDVLREIDR